MGHKKYHNCHKQPYSFQASTANERPAAHGKKLTVMKNLPFTSAKKWKKGLTANSRENVERNKIHCRRKTHQNVILPYLTQNSAESDKIDARPFE
jgi:hypothetical protein